MATKQNILKIDTTTPLRINLVDAEGNTLKLVEEKSEEGKTTKPFDPLSKALSLLLSDRRFVGVLLGFLIVFIVTIVLLLTYFPCTDGLEHSAVGVDYSVEYCSWLMMGDENSVKVTLVNTNSNPITNVIASLIFSDTLPIGTTLDGSNAVSFGDLASGERKTRSIKLMLPIQISAQTLVLPIQTSAQTEGRLQIEAHQITKTELKALRFATSIIPYPKTLITHLWGFTALVLTGAFSWLVSGAMKGTLPPD